MTGPTSPPSRQVNVEGPYGIGSDLWPGTSKVIEECGELGQVLGKLIALGGGTAHWDGSDLRERLHEEIGDVYAALSFFVEVNGLDGARIDQRSLSKEGLFWHWHSEQQLATSAPQDGAS